MTPTALLVALAPLYLSLQRPVRPQAAVAERVPAALRAFALGEVQLRPGPLHDAFQVNLRYLRSLEPERYLWTFRKTAGLPAPGEPYGGWEQPDCELRGHSLGHYLSACARVVAQTGDEELARNLRTTVAGLAECQQRHGNGYLSAFPEELFERVERGERVWAPYYTIHKLVLGLWEAYVFTGDAQAREVLEKLVDYFERRCAAIDDEAMQRMLRTEFGGMHEALLNLYATTGDARHLALAQRFVKQSFVDPLAAGEDRLAGLHANTHIPQVAGQARAYELLGDERAGAVVRNFWDILVRDHTYATGGTSVGEMWVEPGRMADTLTADNQEFCTSYNFEKICRYLLRWTGEARYADWIERLFYNGILVSQHPQSGMFIYYLPFQTGLRKEHGTPEQTFTCCYGTGIQEYASLAQDIFYHDDDGLYVNLFAPAEVTWNPSSGPVRLRQHTQFPAEGRTRLELGLAGPANFRLVLRIPWWATGGAQVLVGGEPQPAAERAKPGSWLTLERAWRDGDVVELALPMPLAVQPSSDDASLAALMCGPLVLAGLVDERTREPGYPTPVLSGDLRSPAEWLAAQRGKPLCWRTRGQPIDLDFRPIHSVVEESYGLYWRFVAADSPAATDLVAARERFEARARRTIDRVRIGDEASEREHELVGERTESGPFPAGTWRHALAGGYFSYRLAVDPQGPNVVAVTYWGSDSGGRTFDVLADGVRLATQTLDRDDPGRLFVVEYPLARELTAGRESIVVRFQAVDETSTAGGVFGLATLRSE